MGNLPGHPVVRSNPYPYRDTPTPDAEGSERKLTPKMHSGNHETASLTMPELPCCRAGSWAQIGGGSGSKDGLTSWTLNPQSESTPAGRRGGPRWDRQKAEVRTSSLRKKLLRYPPCVPAPILRSAPWQSGILLTHRGGHHRAKE